MLLLFLLLSTSPCFKSQSLTSSLSLLFSRLATQVFCCFFFFFWGLAYCGVLSSHKFFFFNFLFFMKKKWIGGDLNWRLPPRRVYSDTLPTGPRSARARDQDDFLFFFGLACLYFVQLVGLNFAIDNFCCWNNFFELIYLNFRSIIYTII